MSARRRTCNAERQKAWKRAACMQSAVNDAPGLAHAAHGLDEEAVGRGALPRRVRVRKQLACGRINTSASVHERAASLTQRGAPMSGSPSAPKMESTMQWMSTSPARQMPARARVSAATDKRRACGKARALHTRQPRCWSARSGAGRGTCAAAGHARAGRASAVWAPTVGVRLTSLGVGDVHAAQDKLQPRRQAVQVKAVAHAERQRRRRLARARSGLSAGRRS